MRSCLLVALVAALLAEPAHAKRRNRAERALAQLWCETQRDDALREARQLRGLERKQVSAGIDQRYHVGRRRAKKATSLEDVMIEVREGYRK